RSAGSSMASTGWCSSGAPGCKPRPTCAPASAVAGSGQGAGAARPASDAGAEQAPWALADRPPIESELSAPPLATLEQRHFQLHSTALEQLTEHLNGLDALCRTLGVTPLSRFVDPTALEFAEASRLLPAEERGPLIPDGETGLA